MEIPNEIELTLTEAYNAKLSLITKSNRVITFPILPFYIKNEKKICFTSSILFSDKIIAIKNNPKVSLLYDCEEGIKNKKYFPILIKGIASVDEEDIHKKWMKLLNYWKEKEPYITDFIKRRYALPLFWERVIINIKPIEILAWFNGKIDEKPIVIK